MTDSRPWLADDRWLDGIARPEGLRPVVAYWLGAAVWNLFAVGVLYATWADGWGGIPLFVRGVLLLFVGLGIPMAIGAAIRTARHLRFRDTHLRLDPFPGSIGGQAGGTVDLPIRAGMTPTARASLHCIRSYMRGSGDDRSRREDVVWSSEVVPATERSGTGVRLAFTFDIPDEDLPETEHDDLRPEDYHYWSVHLAAELPGADLDQTFKVPVYRMTPPLRADRPAAQSPTRDDPWGGRGIDVERGLGEVCIRYRRGRFGFAPFGLLTFGMLTLASGWFVFSQAGLGMGLGSFGLAFGGLFLVVFGLVGLLCVGMACSMILSHREVTIGTGTVRSTRSHGIGRSVREARFGDLERIEARVTMQSGQGSRARTSYTITGRLRGGGRIVLGDGIRGAHLLDELRSVIEDETGIGVEVVRRRRD